MIYNFVIEDSAQVSIIMDYLMDTTKLQLLRDINASTWPPIRFRITKGYIPPFHMIPRMERLYAKMINITTDKVTLDILIRDTVYVTAGVYYI